MEERERDAGTTFSRRAEDQVTPEEKIYPLRFIIDYVAEKKNLLLALEGQSMHQALNIQAISDEILRKSRKIYGDPESMREEDRQIYDLMTKQQEMIHELTVGLTEKGLAFEDIDNMIKQAHPFIMRLMFRDTLTDTYNRYFFISQGKDLLKEAPADIGFSLAFLDIDDFKRCNDVYGHDFGDEALKYLCKTVNYSLQRHCLGHTYFVRMGGDEFILISNELSFDNFAQLLGKLQQRISKGTIQWEDIEGSITVSIGAANSADSGLKTPWEVYRRADERLYKAKGEGKNCIVCT